MEKAYHGGHEFAIEVMDELRVFAAGIRILSYRGIGMTSYPG